MPVTLKRNMTTEYEMDMKPSGGAIKTNVQLKLKRKNTKPATDQM